MTTLTSPSVPSIEQNSRTEPNTSTEPNTATEAATSTEAVTAPAAAPSRHHPSAATGIRHGLVRTRTVRSNTVRALRRLRDDRGAATAEYIVATMAAVGFAGLLIVILRGDEVRSILTELVRNALTVG